MELEARIEQIQERLGKITPGEWSAITFPASPGWVRTDTEWPNPYTQPAVAVDMSHDDAMFLANAPYDIRFLVKAVAFESEQRQMRHAAWLEVQKKYDVLQAAVKTVIDAWIAQNPTRPPDLMLMQGLNDLCTVLNRLTSK